MTRDEAIEVQKKTLGIIFDSNDPKWKDKIAAANIDALIELGLLKVDEPKSTSVVLAINLGVNPSYLERKLNELGFKVTLK